MEDVIPVTVRLPAEGIALASPSGALHVTPASAALPDGTDVAFLLPDLRRVAYAPTPRVDSPRPAPSVDVLVDASLRGNVFHPLHDSSRCLAALVSIAAGRRMESGPESERTFVFLRGVGLVFFENGDTHPFTPGCATLVPAGETARVWAQGPEDVLAVVIQPRGATAERRTLKGELEKRRQSPP